MQRLWYFSTIALCHLFANILGLAFAIGIAATPYYEYYATSTEVAQPSADGTFFYSEEIHYGFQAKNLSVNQASSAKVFHCGEFVSQEIYDIQGVTVRQATGEEKAGRCNDLAIAEFPMQIGKDYIFGVNEAYTFYIENNQPFEITNSPSKPASTATNVIFVLYCIVIAIACILLNLVLYGLLVSDRYGMLTTPTKEKRSK